MGDKQEFLDTFDQLIRLNEPLAGFTTFGIGGPAEMLAEVGTTKSLAVIVNTARSHSIPITVLGEGSNVLIGDGGIEGLVIINRCQRRQLQGNCMTAEAGAHLNDLIDFAIENSLAGMEKLAGIPGTLGGAIIGNAGAYGQSISDVLLKVELLRENGEVVCRSPEDLDFGYRTSRLKKSADIVLAADLELSDGTPADTRQSADEVLAQRRQKLPTEEMCAGSYFKNIEDSLAPHGKIPAGKLLDEAGVKSFREGKAAVSEKHANIIVNLDGATAVDVLNLAKKMKLAVKGKFGIELEEEVRFLGKSL